MTQGGPVGPPVAVSWFVQTAGAAHDQGYRWLAVSPGDDPGSAARLIHGEIAGRSVVSLLSDSALSVVLGRHSDGRYLLVVGGLRPGAAPEKGDYMHRPIRVMLVGVAPGVGDAPPLLDAAAAALRGTLADALPVTWTDDGPAVVGWDTWRIPTEEVERIGRSDGNGFGVVAIGDGMLASVALPDTDGDRSRVAADLVTIAPDELVRFDLDRPLLLATPILDQEDLAALRPWRAVTSAVAQRTTLAFTAKEGRSRLPASCRQVTAGLLGLVLGVVLVAWSVVGRLVARG